MGKVLYECHLHFELMDFLPLIMLGTTILFFIFLIKNLKEKGSVPVLGIKIVKIFFSCMIMFECILISIVIIFQIDLYKKTVIAYQNGDYQIVEGYVENFDPMPHGGHKYETFEINGVKFGYSDYTSMIGYHNAKSHGGVITRNGQHFKIGYVNYNHKNVIVYIEQYPDKVYLDLEE